MSRRQELLAIYANGDIINNDEGVAFTCNDVVVIRVDKEITLDRLKHSIAQKLRLGPNQIVSNLIYRHPISLCPTQYWSCRLEDDDDIQSMWETNSRFPTQLSCAEIYAHIVSTEFDMSARNVVADDYIPAPARSSDHLHGTVDQYLVSTFDASTGHVLSTTPPGIQQLGEPSNYHNAQPSSSQHTR